MKRKIVSELMLTLLVISMLTLAFRIEPVYAADYPSVFVDPEYTHDNSLTPGSTYIVSIMTDYTGDDITSYQFSLTWNPNVLECIEVVNGEIVTGVAVYFQHGPIDNVAGTLGVTGAFFYNPADVASGPGVLANVTFGVVGIGKSNITLGSVQLNAYNGTHYEFIVDGATMPNHIGHGFFINVKPTHDVAVIGLVVPATVIIGQLVSINVIVANEGNFTETFSVIAYTNTIFIETQTGTTLTRADRTTLTFNWDTTDLNVGDCTITAEAILAGDADLTNNHASTTVTVAPGALNPVPPGYYETSEFLIGSVAVGVILPESNGTIDPSTEDWTSTEETQVVSRISEGLDWWAAYNPSADVSFSMEVHNRVPTSYEPISRSLWDHGLWIIETIEYLGHSSVLDYVNDLRNRLGTNWAFVIFVVDSSNDADGSFTDGEPVHAPIGGPYIIMSYFGLKYTEHEIGHTFYATDEYNSEREYSGYLNVSDDDGADCLMNLGSWKLCDATQGQIGWRDTDEDGILDIVDTVPNTTLNPYLPDPASNTTLTYTGFVTVRVYPNHNPYTYTWPTHHMTFFPIPRTQRNITINTITNVEYRIDNGTWMNATTTDGAFDEAQETFTFTTPSLSGGVHTIEVRGTNSVGNVEKTYASDVVTVALSTVTATVNVHPHALNLRSRGRWITVRIELPEGYDVSDIDVSTVMLNGEIQAELHPTEIGDYDGDGIPDLMVKFDRAALTSYVYHTLGIRHGHVTLTITGQLTDGTTFEGSDTIKIKFGGDADLNEVVDLDDFYMWRENFGKTPDQCPPDVHPDFDDNEHVELDDFYVWRDNFGATVPPPP